VQVRDPALLLQALFHQRGQLQGGDWEPWLLLLLLLKSPEVFLF
jgi:hypothetical protein